MDRSKSQRPRISNLQSANPFDRVKPQALQVRAVLGPTAIESLPEEELKTLVQISSFSFLDLMALAPEEDLAQRLEARGFEVGRLNLEGDNVILVTDHSSSLIGARRTLESYQRAAAGAPSSSALEYLVCNSPLSLDFLIGSEAAITGQPGEWCDQRYCTVSAFLERLRLLCSAHQQFEVVPEYRVNEGFYYLYRRDLLFPEFRRTWFYARDIAEDRLAGLWTRLEFICRTADLAMVAALRTPNNDTDASCVFYLGYQYMLAAGVFDDLAALASTCYSLELPRKRITLRRWKGKSAIAVAVKNHNSLLHDFLEEPATSGAIESFYPIRDRLQHREFPKTMGVITGADSRLPSLMLAPEVALRDLARSIDERNPPIEIWPEGAGEATVELEWLCSATLRAMVKVVNGYLGRIPWRSLTLNSGVSEHSGDDFWRRFQRGIGQSLGWDSEPLLFGRAET